MSRFIFLYHALNWGDSTFLPVYWNQHLQCHLFHHYPNPLVDRSMFTYGYEYIDAQARSCICVMYICSDFGPCIHYGCNVLCPVRPIVYSFPPFSAKVEEGEGKTGRTALGYGNADDFDVLLGLLLVHFCVLNLVHHVHARHGAAEDGVLVVEPGLLRGRS